MKYCTKCGSRIDDNAQFCTKCGAKLNVTDDRAISGENKDGKKPNSLLILIVAVVLLILLVVVGKGIFSHKGNDAGKEDKETAKVTETSEKSEDKEKDSEDKKKGTDKKATDVADFSYKNIDSGVSITGYNGTEKKVTVPNKIEGVEVVEIGEAAFAGTEVEEVVLKEGIKTIQTSAFSNTEHLKEIKIPASVTLIGEYAFSRSKIEKVTFEKGKESAVIGSLAFMDCKDLGDIVVPGNYLVIEDQAFLETEMSSFTWEKSTVDGSKLLGFKAFCDSTVEKVDISMEIPEIEHECFFHCEKLTSVKLPDSVETIGNTAFLGSGLETIELPEGLKVIDEGAFSSCLNLKEVVIPSTVEEIRSNSFDAVLEKVTIKEGKNPASLGEDAFGEDNKLTEVIIPKNYTSVYLPYGESLSLIKWEGDKNAYPEYVLYGAFDCPDTDYELEIFLPDGVVYKEDGKPDYNGWRCAKGYFEPIGYGKVVVHIDSGNPLTENPDYEESDGLTFEFYN